MKVTYAHLTSYESYSLDHNQGSVRLDRVGSTTILVEKNIAVVINRCQRHFEGCEG